MLLIQVASSPSIGLVNTHTSWSFPDAIMGRKRAEPHGLGLPPASDQLGTCQQPSPCCFCLQGSSGPVLPRVAFPRQDRALCILALSVGIQGAEQLVPASLSLLWWGTGGRCRCLPGKGSSVPEPGLGKLGKGGSGPTPMEQGCPRPGPCRF